MADDINANIRVDLDTSDAVASLKILQSQISAFNQSIIKSNATAVAAQKSMLATLTAQIGATQQFSTSMVNVESSVSRLGRAIDKNKLSLGEYFRYGVASSKNFGKVFGREHTAIMELATDRVKRLQTQYIALSEAQNGMTRAMAVRPLNLFNADSAIAIQRQQLFNKLLHDGSTSLVNFGKNTQWAGRQLMVGFTVPLTIFGGMAGKVFIDLEKQIVKFRRVYGDATTPLEETNGMIEQVKELAKEFTKYGIAVSDTIALAGDAAAAGAQGEDLLAATTQSTKLSTLGMIDQQQALTATIALQSAFGLNAEKLAESINFLNAVENQTVVSLADITEAIPKVAPVIQGLGGDVQDLAIFMAAMREGGVNAAEGANALKSGLASLINPTKGAREQLQKVGIDIDSILSKNKGDIRATVMEFGQALGTLDKFTRQQTLAKVFGKYQFARLGALFENINKQGSQSQRVLDLTTMSVEDLGAIAEKELGAIEQSVGVKFTAAVEKLRLAIAPIGEIFLKIATPIIEFTTKLADKFNELSPGVKNFVAILVAGFGVVVPTVIMLIGLFANFAGNIVKGFSLINNLFNRVKSGAGSLEYLSAEQLDATAAAASLEGQTNSLTSALNVQRSAINQLAKAYGKYVAAAQATASNLPQGFRRPPAKMATGGMVGGAGNKDTEPALLTPGEFVVNKKAATQNADILSAMNSGRLSRYNDGTKLGKSLVGGQEVILAPHTMLAPGNLPGSFGMSKEFFTQSADFEKSLRTTAIVAAGIEGNIRLIDSKIDDLSKIISPYTSEITDALRLTAKEMQDSGEEVTHISQVFERARTRIDKTLQQMESRGGEVALAARGIRKFAYPTEAEYYAEGERRAPAVAYSQSGRMRSTEYRTKRSRSLGRLRRVFSRVAGYDPSQEMSAAHVTPENQKLLGNVVPFSGSLAAFSPQNTEKERAIIEEKSKRNAMQYGTTFVETAEKTISSGDATGKGLASEAGRRSPHRQAKKNARDDGNVYVETYTRTVEGGLARRGASRPAGPAGLATIELEERERQKRQSARTRRSASRPGGISPLALRPGEELSRVANIRDAQAMAMREEVNKAHDEAIKENTERMKQSTDELEKQPGKLKKFGNSILRGSAKMQGAFFAIDGLVFAASMMNNSLGDFAQKILPAVFAIQGISMMVPMFTSALALFANPIGAAVAAIAAVAVGAWAINKMATNVIDRGKELSKAMFGASENVNKMAEYFGKKTYSQELVQLEVSKTTGKKQSEKTLTEAQQFLESEPGQKLISDINQVKETLGSKKAADALSNQMLRAILSGAIGPKMALAIVTEMGNVLENKDLAVNVAGKINSMVGMDGKKLEGNRMQIFADIIADATDLKRAMADAGAQWDGEAWYSQVSMIITGRGTPDIAAAGLSESIIQGQSLVREELDRNRLAYEQNKITAEEFLATNEKILINAKEQGLTWEGVRDKFRAAYPDEQDQTDAIAQPIINSFLDSLQAAGGEVFRNSFLGSLERADLAGTLQSALSTSGESIDQTISRLNELGVEAGAAGAALSNLSQINILDPQKVREGINSVEELMTTYQNMTDEQRAAQGLNETYYSGLQNTLKTLRAYEAGGMRVAIAVESNQLSPEALQTFLTDKGLTSRQFVYQVGTMTDENSAAIMELLNQSGGKGIAIDLAWNMLANEDTAGLTSLLLEITRGNRNQINVDLVLEVDGIPGLKAANDLMDKFNAIPKKNKKQAIAEFIEINFPNFAGNLDWFLTQDDLVQKTFIANYIIAYDEQGNLSAVGQKLLGQAVVGDPALQKRLAEGYITPEKALAGKLQADFAPVPTATENQKPPSDKEKSGAGTKSWLQGLMDEADASLALLPGMISKIKDKYPNIPVQLLEAIGAGEEGLKNAKEILAASPQKFREFLQKYQKKMVRESLNTLGIKVAQKQNQNIAKVKLQSMSVDGRKVEKDVLEDILQDEGAIAAILSGNVKKINEFVRGYRELQAEQDPVEKLTSEIEKVQKEIVKNLDKEINKQQEIVNGIQDQIDLLEEKNATDQWAIRNKEREKELIDRQIEALERSNEMDQRRIDTLRRQDEIRNREADALNHELEQLSLAEEEIRNSYQKRIEALDKVAEINSFIVSQQRQQLGLSQAISEGDIYAATAAAQEMRAAQADFAQQQARAGLEQGMENAVSGLVTASGLTREQAEERIRQIKEQSYQTSLQIRDIEDVIYQRNLDIIPLKDRQYTIDKDIRDIADRIFDRETEINNIRIKQLEPAQKVLDNLNEQKIKAQETVDEMIEQAKAGAELTDVTKDATGQADNLALAWHEVAKEIDAANKLAKQQEADLKPPVRKKGESDVKYSERMERYASDLAAIRERRQKSIDEALARGRKAMGLFSGGKIKKYGVGKMVKGYAAGNVVGVGNRDSVPAMLTPGEFVIRKTMVDKYGTPMLNAINQGAFNIPRFNLQKSTAGNVTFRSQNTSNVMAPMYNNYSVNVSVSNANASADEIANRTIMKLKQMQNMQIRSGRGY